MLTSYVVRCPYEDCHWFGSLLPHGQDEPWAESSVVVFQCPKCEREWRARHVGDDVEPLPLEEVGSHPHS